MVERALEKLSIREMLAIVARKRRRHARLMRTRASLLKKLRAVDAELGGNGAGAAMRGRSTGKKRARNKLTLTQAMAKAMSKSKAMSVPQIASAVGRAGYRSVSKTFNTIIYQTLAREKAFKKAGRGRYVLK